MTAVALAQLLNCQAPAGDDACGACASCTRIARGVHADVLLIEPTQLHGRRKRVGDLRELRVEEREAPLDGVSHEHPVAL